jgi:hypothetical protein
MADRARTLLMKSSSESAGAVRWACPFGPVGLTDALPLRDAQPVVAQIAAMQIAVLNICLLKHGRLKPDKSL